LRAKPWKPDAALARQAFDWERMLENRDIRLLADNQLTLRFDTKPGIARVQYYPRRRPVQITGKLDYAVLERETQYRAEGMRIQFIDASGKPAQLKKSRLSLAAAQDRADLDWARLRDSRRSNARWQHRRCPSHQNARSCA
jgi:hypothetical protein